MQTRSANTELRTVRVERPEPRGCSCLLREPRWGEEICEVLLHARQHHERAGGRRRSFPCGGRIRAGHGIEAGTDRVLCKPPGADEPPGDIAQIFRRAHALEPIRATAQL